MLDANYVFASRHPRPWTRQLNIMLAYLFFYNPLRLLGSFAQPNSGSRRLAMGTQIIGRWGVTQTIRRTFTWAVRLMTGRIKRKSAIPHSKIPMSAVGGGAASHALPGTPVGSIGPANSTGLVSVAVDGPDNVQSGRKKDGPKLAWAK